jgi:class 3 adenylate cyclase
VIAGIIGTKVVRYDIFGSDVLIANKMESGGEEGSICVSEETKQLLESEEDCPYDFEPNKYIPISSLNKEVNSFFIRPKVRQRVDDSA